MSEGRRQKCLTPEIEDFLDREIPGWDKTEVENAMFCGITLVAFKLDQLLNRHNGPPQE